MRNKSSKTSAEREGSGLEEVERGGGRAHCTGLEDVN